MSNSTLVREEIRKFLESADAEVLGITGKWGVGKTYSWKRYVSEAQRDKKVALKRYAYVSLFGQNSLDDVKYAIFENTVPVGQIDQGPNLATVEDGYKAAEKLGRRLFGWVKDVPLVRDYVSGAGRALFLAVRNQIICIDDLERAGRTLELKDVLGLVSFLKDERGCKVVLLLNQEELDDAPKKDFESQLEKVVDTMMEFSPTPQETADTGLDKRHDFDGQLSADCVTLGITNIRVIRKIERLCVRLAERLKEFDRGVLKQAIHTVTLFGWAHYQPKHAPTFDFLEKYNPWDHLLSDKDNATEQEKSWRALLSEYGFTNMDEFDAVIRDGIKSGYFDPDKLKSTATDLNKKLILQKHDNSFSEAWELYRNSFDDNQDAVLDKMAASVRSCGDAITPVNLSATISLFKELGRPEQAAELITTYMDARKDENPSFFDIPQHPFGGEIKDPDVVRAFGEKLATVATKADPKETLLKIAKSNGWNEDDIQLLASLGTDDYLKLFRKGKGFELHSMIKVALQFGAFGNASAPMITIAANATGALRRIAAESKLNARRIATMYGIAPNEPGELAPETLGPEHGNRG